MVMLAGCRPKSDGRKILLVWEREISLCLTVAILAFLDRFMWIYSGKDGLAAVSLYIGRTAVYKKKWRESILILLAIVLVITLCDQFASHVCANPFYPLPADTSSSFMDQVKLSLITRAADTVLFPAMLLMLSVCDLYVIVVPLPAVYGRFFLWAALTAYTRVYLGVHFISDIVPGAIAGYSLAGWYIGYYVKVRPVVTGTNSNASELYSVGQKRLIVMRFFITVLISSI